VSRPQHAHHTAYRLHALVLARSPYLAHLMSTSPQTGPQRTLVLPLEHEPEVTVEVRASPPFVFFERRCPIDAACGSQGLAIGTHPVPPPRARSAI
jgi:hypothetical protein